MSSFKKKEERREKKKRPRENRSGLVDDTTVRRSLSSSFLKALGSSAWSLEISSKFFIAFPISIRGNHSIGKKKTQTYNNDPKEQRAFLVHAPPPSNTAKSGVVGSLPSKRGQHHHHQRSRRRREEGEECEYWGIVAIVGVVRFGEQRKGDGDDDDEDEKEKGITLRLR
mgnify:CR=1 FL=1